MEAIFFRQYYVDTLPIITELNSRRIQLTGLQLVLKFHWGVNATSI